MDDTEHSWQAAPGQESRTGQPKDDGPNDSGDAGDDGAKRRRRWLIGGLVVAVLLVGLAGFGWYYLTTLRYLASTNDAYLQADDVTVSPKVGGYVAALEVTDNQPVAAGQVLVRIDERDYQAALAQREAAVAQAQADIANQDAQIALQQAKIDQARRRWPRPRRRCSSRKTSSSATRKLESTGNGTVQRAQQTSSNLAQQQAQLADATATETGARRQLDVLRAQRLAATASLQAAQAQLEQAKLNLDYTVVAAPIAGAVGDRSVELGEYVQPGARLMSIVPLGRSLYVVANYKETDLGQMARGQQVELTVDTFPDHTFKGHVDSLAPGTGSQFALLPPENATGNFTKIVQRVPVKITLDPDDPMLQQTAPRPVGRGVGRRAHDSAGLWPRPWRTSGNDAPQRGRPAGRVSATG